MGGEETSKETHQHSVIEVDEKTSKGRIEKLGAALVEIWPKDKSEFKTSVSTACVVDAYYRDSLPSGSPVELMIVSESPCHTRCDLPGMQLNLDALKEAGIDEYNGPLSHVNLVHCLTYGESWAIKEESKAASTQDKMKQVGAGTWKFWKVLATLAGMADVRDNGDDPLATRDTVKDAFKDVIGGGSGNKTKRESRIRAKFQVLKKLKEKGIVLIDVSPFAIFMNGETVLRTNKKTGNQYYTPKYKLSSKEYKAIICAAFETYSGPFLQEVKPKRVLFLGKEVEKAIGKTTIEKIVGSFGGTLFETMIHPSYNKFFGANAAASLQKLRGYAMSSREISMVINVTSIPTSASRKRKQVRPQDTASARERSDDVVDTKSDINEPAKFSEGTIVQVQDRCWPGMNKPGGVARVTKMYHVDAATVYDMTYVLGGRERQVEAVFVSEQEPLKKRRTVTGTKL
jgi:hypothetical protein